MKDTGIDLTLLSIILDDVELLTGRRSMAVLKLNGILFAVFACGVPVRLSLWLLTVDLVLSVGDDDSSPACLVVDAAKNHSLFDSNGESTVFTRN